MAKRKLEAVRTALSLHGQEHVLAFWDELKEPERRRFLKQLSGIDLGLIEKLKAEHLGSGGEEAEGVPGGGPECPRLSELEPPEVITLPSSESEKRRRAEARELGLEAVARGTVACLVVAGGQGSRLGFDGPKGAFPIGPVTDRTLFQLHAEKILAASRRAGRPVPWYVMTSETNDKATREFLRRHGHFGLDPADVFIFQQGMMPALDLEGRMLLAARDRLFTAPNGHGGTLQALADSGALDDMEDRGIEHVYYFQVDNPLVPVPDPVFIGHHAKTDAEMSSKVLRKRSPDEPIGTVVMREGRVEVVEYSDISPELRDAAGADGAPLFPWGSIAIHGLSVRFVRRFTDEGIELPYHVARKKIAHVDDEGRTVAPEERNGIKFEMFIFDALRHAERSVTMEVRREDEFAPVKNAEGADSVATARRSLSGLYARWLEGAGVRVEREPDGAVAGHVEISPLTADSAEALKEALPEGTEFRDGLAL